MKYKEPLYRPPSEADSLIFQVSYGCPHNTCTFCPMYKGVKYKVRSKSDLLYEIKEAGKNYPATKRIFLADGDVMYLTFEDLQEIFSAINTNFAQLSRISLYANGTSILSKSATQLKTLKKLKLFTCYMGLESGDTKILKLVKKGETAEDMIKAVNKAQDCGIRMSVMTLLGLGGKNFTKSHSKNTAAVVNAMNPKFLASLRFMYAPNLKMYDNFENLSDMETDIELRDFISRLDLTATVFRATHVSNPIPLSARFPKDKEKLLTTINSLIGNNNDPSKRFFSRFL